MPVSQQEIQELKDALGDSFITDPKVFNPYTRDMSWMVPDGSPIGAVFAESTEDVSKAVAWANKYKIPVSVRSGGSGLAGGAVSYEGGLVISFHKMTRILEIDIESGVAVVEPGIINADLNKELAKDGYFWAPDPASAGVSAVGGNIATNAGGLKAVCHGVTINWVRALEVVLADGTVVQVGSRSIKNVTSLNLRELFVGSEGTLGIITQAVLRIERIPQFTPYTFLACFDEVEDAGIATIAIRGSGTLPVSLELMDALSVRLTNERNPDRQVPEPGAALLLGQTEGANAKAEAEEFAKTCEEFGATSIVVQEGSDLFQLRRDGYPALQANGMGVIGDVSVPIGALAEMIHIIGEISERRNRRVSILAHAADGNIHPIVECGEGEEESRAAEELLDEICERAGELGGVVSGEHGIGYLKRAETQKLLSTEVKDIQLAIKKALDPNGILTPGRKV